MARKKQNRACDVCGHPLPTLERRGVPMCRGCLECEDWMTGRTLGARIFKAVSEGDLETERRLRMVLAWLERTARGPPG